MSEVERDLVKSFVARIQDLDEEAKILNSDRRELYQEAKGKQLNTKALKRLVADLRRDAKDTEVFERYRSFLAGTPVATRPRAETPQSKDTVELQIDKSRPKPETAVSNTTRRRADSGEAAPSSSQAPQPPADGAASSNSRPIKETAVGITADGGEPASVDPIHHSVAGAGSLSHDPNDMNDLRNHSFRQGPKAIVA